MITLDKYLQNLRSALHSSGSHYLYFPADKVARHSGCLRLARELAFGLRDYDRDEVDDQLKACYGTLIVSNCFDQTGVVLDAKEFLAEVKRSL